LASHEGTALAGDERPFSAIVHADGGLPAAQAWPGASSSGLSSPGAGPATHRKPAILRILVPRAIILVAATIACLGLGFMLAQQADDRAEAGHRQALRGAVEALQAVAPDLPGHDPRLIRILEQASGLQGLRFEDDPPDGDRETQTLLNRNGRIVGWWSWDPERPATASMNGWSPLAILTALGFVSLLAASLWQLRRPDLRLAASRRLMRRHPQQEPIARLPNRENMLDRLDRAATARGADECLAFVIPDLDRFPDAKDAVGRADADEAPLEEQRFIERELGRALAARDFDIHYQPIVTAVGNGIKSWTIFVLGSKRDKGITLPAKGVRTCEPPTSRCVSGSKIWFKQTFWPAVSGPLHVADNAALKSPAR